MGVLHQPLVTAEPGDAGGAYVKRALEFGNKKLKAGDKLTAKQLATIPQANLTALVNTGVLQLWPAAPSEVFIGERFVIPAEGGKFDVIEGHKLTKNPVTKQHALKLAAKG